jgi:tetratricopeptide (TPR) repeat protein
MRKYPEAIALLNALQAEAFAFNNFHELSLAYLMQGDIATVRRMIATAPATSREELTAYLALYNDLYWVLDEEDQNLVLTMGPDRFDNDRSNWAVTLMQVHWLRGNRALARAWADTARVEYEKQLVTSPNDPQRNAFLGLALATLGRKAEAIAAAQRGDALTPPEKDQNNGPYLRHQLIRVYLVLGENEKALDLLEELVKIPYYLTPEWLRIDPNFAPLKGNPRFEKLLATP